MNLLCPNCQKTLAVPEQYAGQMMKCPLCTSTFTVPSLPQAPAMPSVSVGPLAANVSIAPSPLREQPDLYSIQPDPPPPPRAPNPAPAAKPGPSTPPPPPPSPTGTQRFAVPLRRDLVPWVAPAALLFVFVLMFFTWVGAYPGGYRVYSQSGWGALAGSLYAEPVGVKALREMREGRLFNNPFTPEEMQKQNGIGWLMVLYFLLWMPALALVVVPPVIGLLKVPLPPQVQPLWPWRSVAGGAAVLLAFLVLALQTAVSFGLESAAAAVLDRDPAWVSNREKAQTPEEKQIYQIERGAALGALNLQRTWWFRAAVLCHLAAGAGAGLQLWLDRRESKPEPRVELVW